MSMNLTPWLICWAIVTTGVLILFAWRLAVVKQEHGGIHIAVGEERDVELQTKIARQLGRIDFWGKTLTVVSAILVLVIGAAWLYNGWLKANEVIR